MKQLLVLVFCSLFFSVGAGAQTEKFDIISFKTPTGWQKEAGKSAVQLGVDDSATGGMCLVTMFKPLPGSSDSKANFDAAWEAIVEKTVTVSGKPQMQSPVNENGWTAQSGAAAYEADGKKGVVLLVTMSGGNKMVNILVLTNTEQFQAAIGDFLSSVDLPKVKAAVQPKAKPKAKPTQIAPTARKSSYKFSTTTFDDGWTSVEREDWVEVVKGKIKVLIHYPKKGTIFPADPEPLTNAAWDILVAPRYSDLKDYKTAFITAYNRPHLGMGYAVEKASGKQVFILLFWRGATGWLEFVAPDKNSFIQQFKFDPETIKWDSESDLLSPLIQMATYNKFAVAPSDLKGTWTNKYSGMLQYANIYTGADAGANTHASAENFVFGAGNTYKWDLAVASGMVGNLKFQSVKSSGQFSVPNGWQVKFSKIEGKPRTYNASFAAVKGARILWLDGTAYGKVK